MPYDAAGLWVPEDLIKHYAEQGNAYDRPVEGAPGPGTALAQFLRQGVQAPMFRGAAQQSMLGNQALQQQVLRDAAGAKDPQALARMLMTIPPLAGQGIGLLAQSLDPARTLEIQAKQEALKQAQQMNPIALQTAKESLAQAQQVHPLELEIKKRAAEGDPLDQIIRGVGKSIAAPPAAAEPVQKMGGTEMPLLPGVTLTQAAPQTAPTPAQAPVKPEDELIDTPLGKQMTRTQARQLGIVLMMKGKKEAGQQFLDAAGPGMHKNTAHDIDKAEMGLTESLSGFSEIRRLFNPEFLQGFPQLKFGAQMLLSKWVPGAVTPEQEQQLITYNEFMSSAITNLNKILKERSGASVTEQEFKRIQAELPSPGTSPFSGDGPPAFLAKLNQGERTLKLAIARMRYLRKNGFEGRPWDPKVASQMLPLDSMPALIDKRGAEILQQLKTENPGMPDQFLIPRADDQVKREFGI